MYGINSFTSKEELYEFLKKDNLVGLDSEYSNLTDELKKQFNAKGVHFDRWWVCTPTTWKCPVCERKKPELLKINKHGDLSGQLHEHHDHISDLAKKRFDIISASKENIVADLTAQKFVERLSYALASYDKTVICSDCNSADKQAKKIVQAHKDFSFSPLEISKFIIVKNNLEHEIDEDIAKELWIKQQETFNTRLKLVDNIANIAAENAHWYQPSDETSVHTRRKANHYFELQGLKNICKYETETLLYKTVVYSGKMDKWRKESRKLNHKIPTDGEIQHMSNLNGKFWNRLDSDWLCPICYRNKKSCLQPSKKNPWVFQTASKSFYNNSYPRWCEELVICNECHKTTTLIQKEVDLDGELNYSSHWCQTNC
ncbi:MAG: hypothetical protein J7J96_06505 [Sulfurimonas sp.]|nr:hypothetical protein [Sulfurimonas sp.]